MTLYRFVVLALLVASGVYAPVGVFASDATYIQSETLPPQLLPPPPVEGSATWHKQIAEVIRLQHKVSQADIDAMKDEQRLRLDQMTSIIGDSFTPENLPRTFSMLERVIHTAGTISENDKQYWHTHRPYLMDKRVKLMVDPIDASPAYPSGHTTESRVLAEVLGMLAPDKLPALREHAESIALHRVEAGVHYPADLEGGRTLAMLIVGALAANDDFQDDLLVARKEIQYKSIN